MARDSRARFLRELAKVEPSLARAFQEAIADIRNSADLRRVDSAIARAYETGNIAQAVQDVLVAINLEQSFFAKLEQAFAQAFLAGGEYQVGLIPPRAPRLVFRFDPRNPRAEEWTRRNGSRLVTEITQDTRRVVSQTITAGFTENKASRAVALDLIGRTEGNQRKGGLVGLHSTQAGYVTRARAQLESLDDAYFNRTRRDKRYDAAVRRAIRDGKPLSQADVNRIVGRYADRLLQLRGQTISRTEGNKAMQQGRVQAMQQMIDQGKVPADAVTKIWDATISERTRDSHLAMNGTEIAWGEKFISPVTRAMLDHPHDETAPASEVVNCRCTMRVRVDWASLAE